MLEMNKTKSKTYLVFWIVWFFIFTFGFWFLVFDFLFLFEDRVYMPCTNSKKRELINKEFINDPGCFVLILLAICVDK